jgi:RHS repeat-associated protein
VKAIRTGVRLLLSGLILLGGLIGQPVALASDTYLGAPYYNDSYPTQGSPTISTAVDELWRIYQQQWPTAGCWYDVAPIDDGSPRVAKVTIHGECGGWSYIHASVIAHDPKKNLGPCVAQSCGVGVGNPINSAVGNKYQLESDARFGYLPFDRHYNSDPHVSASRLGPNWRHTYDRFVVESSTDTEVSIVRETGRELKFTRDGAEWMPDADVSDRLEELVETGERVGWLYFDSAARRLERYDTYGMLRRITDGESAIDLTYSDAATPVAIAPYPGLLIAVRDAHGREIALIYDAAAHLVEARFPGESRFFYAYGSTGMLESVSHSSGSIRRYVYNEAPLTSNADLPWALTGILDENEDRYASFGYDPLGRAVHTEHGDGQNAFSLEFGGGATGIVEPLGLNITMSYAFSSGTARLSGIDRSCGFCSTGILARTFDSNGYTDITSDFRGNQIDQDFSADGLELKRSEADGMAQERSVETDWHATFRVPTERRVFDAADALVARTNWTYNARGQALAVAQTDPATGITRTITTTYCEQEQIDAGLCPLLGLVRSVDGPRADVSDTTSYAYRMADEASCATAPTTCAYRRGDLWKVTNAIGQVTETLKYDGAGRVLSMKDANGVITDLEYHPRGWLSARKVRGTDGAVETDDQITRIDYWPTGLVKRVTQPDGAYTRYEYDAAHRLTDIFDNAGNTIHYVLDNAGNRLEEQTKDAGGVLKRTLSRVYNQLGQLETQTDASDNPTDFTYDANGNAETVTEALGRITDNDYDPLNRLKRTLQDVDGIAAETEFEYDVLDNLTKVTDPKGLDTDYRYNAFGDLEELSSPDTGTTTYTYDGAANRKTQADARGVVTTYSYDALNRLKTIAYSDGTPGITYAYDEKNTITCTANERFNSGRLTRITDASGNTQLCYDRFGNLVRKHQITNSRALTLRYAYTKAGQLQSLTYPNGAVVDYVRNALGQVTEVGYKPASGARQIVLNQAAYLPFGPVSGWRYGNGRQLARGYDQDYRPTSIHDGAAGGLSVGFGFDEVGNLDKLTPAFNPAPLVSLDYDTLNRLTHFRDGPTQTPIETYTYDKTGNRQSFTNSAGNLAYTYPATSHRLAQVGAIARAYDAAGNTAAIGGTAREFVYDGAGRMSQAKRNGAVVMHYRYNGKGEQVRKYLGTANTYTVYDEAGRWLGDYDNAGAPLQQAIWLDDLPVGLTSGPTQQLHYIEPDHLGTPRVVIDPVRNVAVWNWDLKSEAFGNSPPNQDPDGDRALFVLDMRFPGQRYDAASGLNQNGFRDYEASGGRYIQSDPLGLSAGPSVYAYVNSDPLGGIDPFGLENRVPSSHTWRANADNYSGPYNNPIPYTPPGVNVPLTFPVHNPTRSYWEEAALGLSPWDYTKYCVSIWCMRRLYPDKCSPSDKWEQQFYAGGPPPTLLQVRRAGCECRKSFYRDQLPRTKPDQADILDAAELAARLRQLRATR